MIISNTSPVKLILFDIGGVLINYDDAFKTASKEQNIPIELIDRTFDKYDREITIGAITPQDLYLHCIADNQLSANTNYNFMLSWIDDYKTIAPSFELLMKLQDKYRVGLLSNTYKGMVGKMIRRNLIPNINYANLFISCDIGMQKPDADIYQHVLDQTRLNPNEILFVDDRDDYLAPAGKLGMNCYQYITLNIDKSVAELAEMLI